MTDEPLIKRIQKLLSLGQNNQNQHEAEAAMKKVQKLLTEHNLTMADLGTEEEYMSKKTGIGSVNYTFKVRNIVQLIQVHYAVTVLIVKGGRGNETKVKFFGTQENVDSAIFAFHFLSETFERLWSKEYVVRCEGQMSRNQIANERNSFMLGVRQGLDHKLTAEKQAAAEEHYNQDQDKANNALVVLNDKSLILNYMAKAHPKTSSISGAQVRTSSSTAFDRGYQKGSKINIAKAIA